MYSICYITLPFADYCHYLLQMLSRLLPSLQELILASCYLLTDDGIAAWSTDNPLDTGYRSVQTVLARLYPRKEAIAAEEKLLMYLY